MIQFDCQTWFLYGSRQFWIGSLDILIPYGKSNEEEATLAAPTAVQGRYKRNKPSDCLCCTMGLKKCLKSDFQFHIQNLLTASTKISNHEHFLFNFRFVLIWSKFSLIKKAREFWFVCQFWGKKCFDQIKTNNKFWKTNLKNSE